jgi:hypothetical protein
MTKQDPDKLPEEDVLPEEYRRSRRVHGGMPTRLDDDRLARLTEEERVEAGVDDFDPDEVPPATDEPPQPFDVTETDEYQETRAEIRREYDKDELELEHERSPFPPSHYDE